MATGSPGFLPGEILWTEEPGRLQSMGLQSFRHDLATKQRQQFSSLAHSMWQCYLRFLGSLGRRPLRLKPISSWALTSQNPPSLPEFLTCMIFVLILVKGSKIFRP